MKNYYFTSESVTPGHPDKICDQITDAIVDAAISQDPASKCAVECSIKDNFVLLFGEITTKAQLDFSAIAKQVIADIGYKEEFEVLEKISQQSAEIHAAVTADGQLKAGDQGIMFGYASNETDTFMPLSIDLAHRLSQQLYSVFLNDQEDILRPDGKTQVTVEYENNQVKRIDSIVVSAQHSEKVNQKQLREFIIEKVILPVTKDDCIDKNTKFIINPSGSFTIGGPFGDSGTTGRKIIVDTYGGHGRIGGGALSSKDPSKVDRSAAYYSRFVAKNIVAAELASQCEIQVAYAIGMDEPLSVFVETFGSNKVPEEEILRIIKKNFDFSVTNIISSLNLLQPIYQKTANFGHFGRHDVVFPWEEIINLKI